MKREGGARPARRRGKAAKTPSGVASVSSPSSPAYVSAGKVEKTIDVGLSYKIVELFSEGLYTSANKAFEELVTNSFDAGARNVHILLPTDPTAPEAAIVVVDDGEAMNVLGLEELWQIGFTQKRTRADPPLGRRQIVPKPKDVVVRLDRNVPASSASYFGLYHPTLGRVTGYAEAYKDVLTTGKSIEIGRSYGFFVYVRGRLINIEDEYFGIDSNLLRHGTFSRFRLVVYIDKLDEELRSTREAIREGPAYDAARNLLHSIFNYVRPKIEEAIEAESSGSRMSRKLSGSPASLPRRPIIELARAALGGHAHPRLVRVPVDLNPTQQQEFIGELERRAEAPSGFVTDVQLTYALTTEDGIALFDTETCVLRINALHPFIGSFSGDFLNHARNFSLELLAMAEVLLEAQLYRFGYRTKDVNEIMLERDELLRYLAKSTGRRNSLMVAQDLADACTDQDRLEDELVAVFDKLGFDAVHLGGPGRADGVATAHLSGDEGGRAHIYSVSLEAKSMETSGKKVAARTVGISAVARHRHDLRCKHAVIVGPDFPTSRAGASSALAKEITANREKDESLPARERRTITLIRINDLAKLVRIAPLKQLNPSRIQELFQTCLTPEEASEWITRISRETPTVQPFKEILEAIWAEQRVETETVVEYTALRVRLRDDRSIRKTLAYPVNAHDRYM